jgi:hypothetical protein
VFSSEFINIEAASQPGSRRSLQRPGFQCLRQGKSVNLNKRPVPAGITSCPSRGQPVLDADGTSVIEAHKVTVVSPMFNPNPGTNNEPAEVFSKIKGKWNGARMQSPAGAGDES